MHAEMVSTAKRKTFCPSMAISAGCPEPGPAARSSSAFPLQPVMALMEGHSWRDSTTTAPAPSPKRIQLPRSSQLTMRLSASPPMTSASFLSDAASRHSAVCSANTKPEQAAFRSKHSVSVGSPSAFCTEQAVAGIRFSGVMVATMHTAISSGAAPLDASALRAAAMHSPVCVSSCT